MYNFCFPFNNKENKNENQVCPVPFIYNFDNANHEDHEDDNKTNNVKLTSSCEIVCSRMTIDMMAKLQLNVNNTFKSELTCLYDFPNLIGVVISIIIFRNIFFDS